MKTLKTFTDSVRECECCGKTNLKGTFLLVDEFNNEFYYGSSCAMNVLNISKENFNKEYLKIKNIEKFDNLISLEKIEYRKVKLVKDALKNGYDKKELFLKFGKKDLDFSNLYMDVYFIGNLNYQHLK